jgi:cation:H+ antiporter
MFLDLMTAPVFAFAWDTLPGWALALLMAIGLMGLCLGGDFLVRGAASIALRLNMSPIVIGLTVVSIGTSSPEFITSLIGALKGKSEIAIGNIIGSNLCNIGLILGIAALIKPIRVQLRLIRQEVPWLLVATLVFMLFCWRGQLSRVEGFFMLGATFIYLTYIYLQTRSVDPSVTDEYVDEFKNPIKSGLACLLLMGVGIILLALGADWFVNGAIQVARKVGLSELIIGLTIVAVGTSLPELTTSVIAALRGQSDICAGNIVGSNLFNILLIGGGVAAIQPFDVSPDLLRMEFPAMIFLTLLLWLFFLTGRKITRWEGFILLLSYGLIVTLSLWIS